MKYFKKTLLQTIAIFAGSILSINSVLAEGLNGPHKHGTLEVSILKSSDQLVFDMVVPAQNIVGFEQAPKNDEEKKRVNAAEVALYTAENLRILFNFFPTGSCLPYESYVNSDLLNIHSHPKDDSFVSKLVKDEKGKDKKEKAADDVHVVGANGHTDFVMSYVFNCQGVSEVSLNFAKIFPSIKKINIRKKSVEGKIITTLKTAKNTTIKLKDI
ncbi:MAG TPA: DUF2796 domain-containing protein [Leucothrix mucor]|nr:DUF2796 domain-containing protein [Leucothrix mucor]